MRLLRRDGNGEITRTRDYESRLPSYAILSHTWLNDDEEVAFEELASEYCKGKAGYRKLEFCGKQAQADGLQYFWVDTCCINKTSATELSEAIISMFRWYQDAAKCYVHLADVRAGSHDHDSNASWQTDFRHSRWFRRGWTLQELLAPRVLEFFSADGKYLGDKSSLEQLIHETTAIPIDALRGSPLSFFSIEERLSWASKRETTRQEDKAYSLQGLFGVFIPVLYGEREHAFVRLRAAINEKKTVRFMEQVGHQELQGFESSAKSHRATKEARAARYAATKKDMLDLLRFDEIDDRHANIKKAHAKTCQWVVECTEYLTWLDDNKFNEHNGVLWIKGKPGSGKSTLMKFLHIKLERLFPSTMFLPFFFNARGTQLEKSAAGLYRSLLVRILENYDDEDDIIRMVTKSNHFLNDRLPGNIEKLQGLLSVVVQSLDDCNITIIVDALDEGDEEEIRDMIEFFEMLGQEASSKGKNFRTLFSSRYYPHISVGKLIELKIEDQQGHAEDIDNYLMTQLRIGNSDLANSIRWEISHRASGVFIWVVLVIQILNKTYDSGHVHGLRKKLDEIPDDLDHLFGSILGRDHENMNESQLCLQWILLACRPLRREELYFAILAGTDVDFLCPWDPAEISTETIDLFILSSSKGLAEITTSTDFTAQFIHESVRDFLLKKNRAHRISSTPETTIIDPSHDNLKICCAQYIQSDMLRQQVCAAETQSSYRGQRNALRSETIAKFPFIRYSVDNVLVHAEKAQADGVDQLEFLLHFNLTHWIRSYNLLQRSELQCYREDTDMLYLFAHKNYAHLIRSLLRCQQQVHCPTGRYGNPVFAAIANNSREALHQLMLHDTKEYSTRCKFPYQHPKIITFLLNHLGSSLTTQILRFYNFGFSPEEVTKLFYTAAAEGHDGVLDALIHLGIPVDRQKRLYDDALRAASCYGHALAVRLLLNIGADINAHNKEHGSPLIAASLGGHYEVVYILVKCGADLNSQEDNKGTALYAASLRGNASVLRLLLGAGADPNVPGGFFGNALQAASERGHSNIVQDLVRAGANVDASGGYYGNALQAASIHGHVKIVSTLVRAGANINVEGGLYGSAHDAASMYCHDKVIQILVGSRNLEVLAIREQ